MRDFGNRRELVLNLLVPKDPANYGKKWEEMVLVQPDEGLTGFVRVQVETREEVESR